MKKYYKNNNSFFNVLLRNYSITRFEKIIFIQILFIDQTSN